MKIQIWDISLGALTADFFPIAFEILSTDEIQRAQQFRFERDQLRFAACRYALRLLLSRELSIHPKDVEFATNDFGKPLLPCKSLHFNLSHAGTRAAIAIHPSAPIGIDIEPVRTLEDADEIAERFFSESEHKEYLSLHVHRKAHGFFTCWTRKEALIKAVGEGLSYPLKSFDVSLSSEARQDVKLENHLLPWKLYSYSPHKNYVAALATQLMLPLEFDTFKDISWR